MNTTLIIPAAYKDQVNEALTPKYGPDNFSIPIEENGVITSYGCSWIMSPEVQVEVEAIINSIVPQVEQADVIIDDTKRFDEVLVENELTKAVIE